MNRPIRWAGPTTAAALIAVAFYVLGLRHAAVAVIGVAALSAWLFIIQYWWTSRGAWVRSWIGRHVMAFVGADALVFTTATVAVLSPSVESLSWFQWMDLAFITGIPATIIQRMWILRTVDRLVEATHPAELENTPPTPPRPSRMAAMIRHPMLLWKSILSGITAVAGVAYLADVVGGRTAAVIVVLAGACQAATTTYEHGLDQSTQQPGG